MDQIFEAGLRTFCNELEIKLQETIMKDLIAEFTHAMEPIIHAKVRELMVQVRVNKQHDPCTLSENIYIKFGQQPYYEKLE